MTARTSDHQPYKTLPRTPSAASRDPKPSLDVARHAANLSFSSSPKVVVPSPSSQKTPNAALLAAQITGTKTPSPNSELKTRGRLSRTVSYDSQSVSSAGNGSLAAAQAIAKRYSTLGTKPSREELLVRRSSHNQSPSKHSLGHIHNDPLIAAQRSASRKKSFESSSSILNHENTVSIAAASLAASRSSTFSMDRNRDQEDDILPSRGSVQEAKRRLFQNDNSSSSKTDVNSISAHNTGQSNGAYQAVTSAAIKKSFEAQRLNGVSKLSLLESPTPVRSIDKLSTGESLTAALNAVRRSPSVRQDKPSQVSQLQSNQNMKIYDPSSMVEIDQSKMSKKPQLGAKPYVKSFDARVNPPEIFSHGNFSTNSIETGAVNAASTAMKDNIMRKSPPALPPPRRTKIDQETFKPPQGNIERDDSYFSDRMSKRVVASLQDSRTQQTFMNNPSTVTLPILPIRRSISPPPAPVLSRNLTGPNLSSTTAAALAFSSPSHKISWRDDLSYLSHIGRPLSHTLTGDSSHHAVMASFLASSRAPSPAKVQLVTPPPLRPNQGLRTTLRKPDKKEEREQSPPKTKKHLVKHPHKHHEGTRRRWREIVTEKERRRYEGLWAANRGLYLPDDVTPDGSMRDGVCSVVVRDLWNRSRLPSDVLENVWDLVDRKYKGWLTREEFIMGLWLIDQSLKGRKLPSRVQAGTWESIHRLGVVLKDHRELGVKPEKYKKGRHGF